MKLNKVWEKTVFVVTTAFISNISIAEDMNTSITNGTQTASNVKNLILICAVVLGIIVAIIGMLMMVDAKTNRSSQHKMSDGLWVTIIGAGIAFIGGIMKMAASGLSLSSAAGSF